MKKRKPIEKLKKKKKKLKRPRDYSKKLGRKEKKKLEFVSLKLLPKGNVKRLMLQQLRSSDWSRRQLNMKDKGLLKKLNELEKKRKKLKLLELNLNKKRLNEKLKRKERKQLKPKDLSKKKENEPKKKQESVNSKPKPKRNVKRLKLLPQRDLDYKKKLQKKRGLDLLKKLKEFAKKRKQLKL